MSHAAGAGHHHEEPNTGIDSRKLGFWIFLSSECVFFASLIVGYLVYRGKSVTGPYPLDVFDIPLTTVSTFVLLMSSFTMVLAVASAQRGDRAGVRKWLLATVVGGLVFLGFQAYEFTHFVHAGLTLSTNVFGTSFFTLTGFHGAHVAVGVLWLLSVLIWSLRGGEPSGIDVEIAGLYWHFVDVVWIVIFTVVYLMEVVG